MNHQNNLKILHAPVNIGNQPWALSRAERRHGYTSDVVVNYNTWLNYKYDYCIGGYAKPTLINKYKRLKFAFNALKNYNIFHYYFGRTLTCWDDYSPRNKLWYFDLKLAKKLGKKIFMTLQGCDVRLAGKSNKYETTPCHIGHCKSFLSCLNHYDNERLWLIKNILPKVNKVFFLNPELGHYVPNGQFLPYAIGNLFNLLKTKTVKNPIPKIVHAPSDPHVKGTNLIINAIHELKKDYNFEFILVKNKSHAEAMQIYKSADIAIDQILCGWYGAFAVELLAMGKPVLCYIRPDDLKFIPIQMQKELPFFQINPKTLKSDIARFLDIQNEWSDWSVLSRDFIYKWHNVNLISKALLHSYMDKDSVFSLF